MYWNYVIGLCVELLRTKCTIFSKYFSFWNVVLTLASFLLSICSICSRPRANESQTAIFVAKQCSFANIGFGFRLPWSTQIFSKMVHWNKFCYFALQSVHHDASFKLSNVAIQGFSVFTFVRDTLTSAVKKKNVHMPKIA